MLQQRTNLISKEMSHTSRRGTLRTAAACAAIALLSAGIDGPKLTSGVPVSRRPVERALARTQPVPVARVAPAAPRTGLTGLEAAIRQKFSASKTLVGLKTHESANGLDITFSTDRIFPGGTARFDTGTEAEVSELVSVIGSRAKNFEILVEGHTDDVPIIKNRKRFSTNWELGGARAAAIVSLFERAGVERNRLEAISYGASRPEFSRKSRNRRVVIRLLKREQEGS